MNGSLPHLSACFALLLGAALHGGCIAYVHDKKSETLKPAKAALVDFAGTNKEHAVYSTGKNKLGLMGHQRLSGAISGIVAKEQVKIEVTSAGDIVVASDQSRVARLTFVNGKDFEFVESRVVFKFKGKLDSHDSPGIAVWKRYMQWLIDEAGHLHVLTSSKGIGMMTIIPAAAVGGTSLSIFERADRSAHVSP